MWKEKQRQVKAEEEKSKNNKSVMSEARTSNLVIRPQAPGAADIVEEESWNKHKWVISDVCYRELWTEQAEILIRQVQLTEWLLFKLCKQYIYIQFSSLSNICDYPIHLGSVSAGSTAIKRSKSVSKGKSVRTSS